MSHQTGIRANEALKKFFGKCRDGKIRVFKVSIKDEELTLDGFKEKKSSWENDYDKFVPGFVEPEQPSFILYRLDTRNQSGGYDWLLISWSPDDSPVRQKMLYASTKATLKQEFGSGQIIEELHATVADDVTLKGLQKQRMSAKTPAPLTTREEELATLTSNFTDISIDSRTQTLSGIAFPIDDKAKSALVDIKNGKINYVQLKIDLVAEEILLASTDNVAISSLPKQVPAHSARYHVYNFKHTHEGDFIESVVFIYSMPADCTSVKEKMLYSSCKAPFLDTVESMIGLHIDKRLEIDCGEDLTEEFLQDEIHPKKCLHRPKFDKPKGPPGRGAKRLTKTQQ
ncbi:twinfilin actin binding protein [Lycorma delicatula]|uniref:twinfilin actin binding protein n=1 Tax=Lycorma delicatula TaxID=130591 RepID=UPI003F518AD7